MNIADEYVCNRKDDNMEFNYSYRLIKSDYRGTPVYGIEIERKDYIGIKNINIERDKVTMISFEKDKAEDILKKLYQNQLSPIHLVDIIGCYADEFSYEADYRNYSEKIN
ncbi:DUF6514 family protein [Clostridium sp. 3-3]|uniref:DUF6514 family protein n=1 Tax=Clostridium sp. 3-3 TaxID=2070757 RepID=UPI000CDB4CEF|nr:DUF6514 family protein [Clostridium sp. 3-3]POO86950.1 hypothetical protein C1H59_08300 [Clostridium sp. 3-3]